MKPLPWSFSALDDFVNCPRQYHAKRVAKTVKEERTEAIIWGERVHKHFEDRQRDGVVLPVELEEHEPFMAKLEKLYGTAYVEQRIALNVKMQPCDFFAKDVWFRGVIDWAKFTDNMAFLIDYKTGKPKNLTKQLKLFALHTFISKPEIELVDARYYWTQTCDTSGERYMRYQVPDLWKEFLPDLKQYAEAFQTDTWQPRPSGLCHGWCPVQDCEFWKPGRKKR